MNAVPTWELSGWWRRVGAYIIDAILIGLVSGAIVAIAMLASGAELLNAKDELSGTFVLLIMIVGYFAMPTIYYCWMMSATDGQTLGKKALDIRVVREDGLAVDAWFAFKRQILVINIFFGMILGFFLFGLPQLIDYLWPLWDAKNQALHDKVVKSRVVKAAQVIPTEGAQQPYFTPGEEQPSPQPAGGQPYYGQLPPTGEAPFPQGTVAPPPPPSAPPPPPAPGGASTPYTPPPGFENPVPEDDKS